MRGLTGLCAALCAGVALAALGAPALAQTPEFRQRPPEAEVIYFLLPDRFENGDASNDRGGLSGDRLTTGYDPTDPGFFHGGDFDGLTQRLDYIQGLGATAVWVAPIFQNKAVQGPRGHESAAYHGYWITDFTRVDDHFGDNAAFARFVDAAHARGIKVYIDIVANHTADVIQYRDCERRGCSYRSQGDYPYSRQGGVDGAPINDGFDGVDFSRLTRPDYAYDAYVPEGERDVKVPAWLNDPIYYHNRGNSDWFGESNLDGDFSGLDDLFTENPRVVQGFIDIYGAWIDRFGIDGFRIDTARHVNPAFWRAFIPAMRERAAARGIPNFHIFGEAAETDPALLAGFTRSDRYPAVLDFAFQKTVKDVVAGTEPPEKLALLFRADVLYEGGEATAMQLPTFVGNHDQGRFGRQILDARPDISDEELLARQTLAHAMMMFLRGTPVIYYGDEQGFTGDGDDRRSRQDMFETQVPSYADDRIIGERSGPFDTNATLYRRLGDMARLRHATPSLVSGLQTVRQAGKAPGLFVVSRRLPGEAGETLIAFNTSTEAARGHIVVDARSSRWASLHGQCAPQVAAPGSLAVSVPALDYVICRSEADR
jgi:neopullulanase